MKNNYGVVEIDNLKDLTREIELMLPFSTISLIGPSGTGKTYLTQQLINNPKLGIDKLVILRLQGLTSEDFRIPVLNTTVVTRDGVEREEKQVDFATIGIFKEIDDNPETKYLLFFDKNLVA